MRPWRIGVLLGISLAMLMGMLGAYTFAQSDRQTALAQLEKLETRRASEEFNLQMGVGLSDELKQGYTDLVASAAGISDVVDWATYRLAEWDYSRDRFQAAIVALLALASSSKDKTISLEAQLLAAEILDSPWNPQRDPAAADQLLTEAESKHPGSNRAAVAALARQSTRLLDKKLPAQAGQVLARKLNNHSFKVNGKSDPPYERVAGQKHNKELAKGYRNQAISKGAQRDYAGAYETLSQALTAYSGDNPYDFFTFTSAGEDLEFQRALALAAQGRNEAAIAELKSVAAKYPNSHLSLRAQARIEALDPQPVAELKTAYVAFSDAGVLSSNNACVCGPAALRTAFSFLGKEVPLESLVKAAGTTSEGTTMTGMVAAAKTSGLQAYGLRISKADLERLPTPFVALWYDHYVTVTGASDTEVSLFDPLVGFVTKTPAEFNALWEGVALVFGETEAQAVQGLTGTEVLASAELTAMRGSFL